MRRLDLGDGRDPAWNLALEEWCVRHMDPGAGVLLLYVNDPAIVVGKNQNVHLEADLAWARRRAVPVVRRISGGGTVYHDAGNLNFGFVRPYRPGTALDVAAMLEPVARALRAMGVPAERNARNDLLVDGRKVSGNAQFVSIRSMLCHGTLLFDADLDDLRAALRARTDGIDTRAVRSVPSRVTNLRPYLPAGTDLAAFRERLASELLGPDPEPPRRLDDVERAAIERLAETRYRTWAWNHGRAPRFTVRRSLGGADEAREIALEVEAGIVRSARFAAGRDRRRLAHLAAHLTGARFDRGDLRAAFERAGADPATDGGDADALAACLAP